MGEGFGGKNLEGLTELSSDCIVYRGAGLWQEVRRVSKSE
jgi:hypothetical protein